MRAEVSRLFTCSALFLTFCALAGCRAGFAPVEDGASVIVTSIEPRIDAINGRTIVTPVELAPASEDSPDEFITNRVRIALEDGASAVGDLFRVTPRFRSQPDAGQWLIPGRWWDVQPAGFFTVRDLLNQESLDPGFWALVTNPPPWASLGDMRIGDSRFGMRWRDSWRAPRRTPEKAAGLTDADIAFLRTLRPLAMDPTTRWRLRLLAEGLWTGAPAIGDLLEPTLGHSVLDAIDGQITDRWRIALSALDEIDSELADEVFRALTRVAFLGENAMPAWDPDEERTQELLAALLDPLLARDARAQRARAWLDEQASLRAWIQDDAGLRAERGGNVTVVASAVWFGSAPAIMKAHSGDVVGPEVAAQPGRIVRVATTIAERTGDPMIVVHADREEASLLSISSPLAAEPPGLRIGPLFETWTLESWLADESIAPEVEWMTAALLFKEPARDVWTMYIECRTPEGFAENSDEADVVRLWLGRTGRSASILRVTSDGRAYDEVSREDRSSTLTFRQGPDRWSALLPIPPHAIDGDGVLRLALERFDPRGMRTTWPRPLLPWDFEPGRVSVDLNRWNELRPE